MQAQEDLAVAEASLAVCRVHSSARLHPESDLVVPILVPQPLVLELEWPWPLVRHSILIRWEARQRRDHNNHNNNLSKLLKAAGNSLLWNLIMPLTM